MKLTITRADLVAALSKVKPIISGASTLPVMNCVRLTAFKDALSVTANNLDESLELFLKGVDVVESGIAVVSASRLLSGLAKMEADEVTLTMAEGSKSLEC